MSDERVWLASESNQAMDMTKTAIRLLPFLVDVTVAAKDEHDEQCGCKGEACRVGRSLAALQAAEKELSE
jgi:hypothetical protein